MPVDFKQTLLEDYRDLIETHSTSLKERFYKWYAKLTDPIEYTHLLLWAAYGSRAWKMACDYTEEMERIGGMADELETVIERAQMQAGMLNPETVTGGMFRQAFEAMREWNEMNLYWYRYRKAHADQKMPYVKFVPHAGFLGTLAFCVGFRCEDWPLIQSWEEFFLILPLSAIPDDGGYSKPQEWMFKDYVARDNQRIINDWYMERHGYGANERTAGRTWGRVYQEELQAMSNEAVLEEYKKKNWGIQSSTAEALRRKLIKR